MREEKSETRGRRVGRGAIATTVMVLAAYGASAPYRPRTNAQRTDGWVDEVRAPLYFAVRVESLERAADVVADRAASDAGERPRVVVDERLGLRILQLTDPDGNIIQLSSPVGDGRSDRGAGE